MIVQAVDIALRPVGMPPIRVFKVAPPLAEVSQIDRMVGRGENQRAGIKHMRLCTGIALWIRGNFRECLMSGGADEVLELPVSHRCAVDPEAIDGDAMDWRLFRVMFV